LAGDFGGICRRVDRYVGFERGFQNAQMGDAFGSGGYDSCGKILLVVD